MMLKKWPSRESFIAEEKVRLKTKEKHVRIAPSPSEEKVDERRKSGMVEETGGDGGDEVLKGCFALRRPSLKKWRRIQERKGGEKKEKRRFRVNNLKVESDDNEERASPVEEYDSNE